jgi:hypothetical protein
MSQKMSEDCVEMKTLADYVEWKGYGAISDLMKETGLSYSCVWDAVNGGQKRQHTARLLHEATGRRVPLLSILYGDDYSANM